MCVRVCACYVCACVCMCVRVCACYVCACLCGSNVRVSRVYRHMGEFCQCVYMHERNLCNFPHTRFARVTVCRMDTTKFTAYASAELAGIEAALKEWFLTRRFRMERALAIKKELDENNFSGLSLNNPDIPPREASMWRDLVIGRPAVEAGLSADAASRKIEMYTNMFDQATDGDHPCRAPGMTFLACIDNNRTDPCSTAFTQFDACRASILTAQKSAIDARLVQQDVEDKRAKALFERRQVLIDTLAANTAKQ